MAKAKEASSSCDHLAALCSDLTHIPALDTDCNRCHDPKDNWLCLCCKDVLCSRRINKHMLQHFHDTTHCLALGYIDLSVWCYICNAYLDAKVILPLCPVYETAYQLKFGEAPPLRSVDMSSFSNTDGVLRARSKICYCGFKAILRIDEKNEGKLYYACPKKKCSLREWCKGENSSGCIEEPTIRKPNMEVEQGPKSSTIVTRVDVLEGRMKFLKLFVTIAVGVSFVSLVLSLVK